MSPCLPTNPIPIPHTPPLPQMKLTRTTPLLYISCPRSTTRIPIPITSIPKMTLTTTHIFLTVTFNSPLPPSTNRLSLPTCPHHPSVTIHNPVLLPLPARPSKPQSLHIHLRPRKSNYPHRSPTRHPHPPRPPRPHPRSPRPSVPRPPRSRLPRFFPHMVLLYSSRWPNNLKIPSRRNHPTPLLLSSRRHLRRIHSQPTIFANASVPFLATRLCQRKRRANNAKPCSANPSISAGKRRPRLSPPKCIASATSRPIRTSTIPTRARKCQGVSTTLEIVKSRLTAADFG